MAECEVGKFVVTGGNLTAYGVVDLEFVAEHLGEPFANFRIFLRRFGGLTENLRRYIRAHLTVVQHSFEHQHRLDDYGFPLRLPHQSEHFSVSHLAENQYLPLTGCLHRIVGIAYSGLELEHHRTSAVHHIETQGLGLDVGGRRLTVCPNDEIGILNGLHFIQVFHIHCHQPGVSEPSQNGLIVDQGTQGENLPVSFFGQFRFSDFHRPYHSGTESGILVHFNFYVHFFANLFSIRSRTHSIWSSIVIDELSSTTASGAWVRGETSLWESM